MREIRSLCRGWRYLPRFEEAFLEPGLDVGSWAEVCLPHTNLELPYNGFDEKSYQFLSTYLLDLELPPLAEGRRAFLDFEGVMAACELWLDGRALGSHRGGYTPFGFEITDFLREGGSHRLLVKVDSTERSDFPPYGHVVDYLSYGGIYREASLRLQDEALIAEVFAKPRYRPGPRPGAGLEVELLLDLGAGAGGSGSYELEAILSRGGSPLASVRTEVGPALNHAPESGGRDGRPLLLEFPPLEGIEAWEPDRPSLYDLELSLREGGRLLDRLSLRIGFREARFTPEGFFLNGRRLFLRGLNRHQSWPYQGYAMPARAQRRDAEILKMELGLNLVRTSHYPQSRHFLDACDELGLLVFAELPGWQHIGDGAWKEAALLSLEELIRRDRNHPSVCLWGVRINESKDDHEFYARSNELARRLDPTRQTGGVRFIERSELLEDVYTFNDFSHAGGAQVIRDPTKVLPRGRRAPYLITEHNGHMFPTKRFDNEERLVEHALRHLRVLDAAGRDGRISGAVGWCAFDYNTHKDFGSGDRICYHGVMDMFRIPKYGAYAYASQRPPAEGLVLEAASLFAKGERAAARLLPIVVFTNCDEIVLYRNGLRIGSYLPAREDFPALPHPPVLVRDLIGDQLEGSVYAPGDRRLIRSLVAKVLAEDLGALSRLELLRFGLLMLKYRMNMADAEALVARYALGWGSKEDGFRLVGIVGGKESIERSYGGDAFAARLSLAADDQLLSAGDWDTTRILVRLEDQYGKLYPYAAETVEVEIEGPAALIGPSRLPLIGGCIAYWIRTRGEEGTVRTRVRGSRFDSPEVRIEVG